MPRQFLRRIAAAGALVTGLGVVASALVDVQGGLIATTRRDFQMPGTQPGPLPAALRSSQDCAGCHGYYDPTVEPYSRWASSMMAQATRDPIFFAALAIAEQDAGDAGDLCLRCHSPNGWSQGRAFPTDGSALDPAQSDFDGVSCHFCHRLVDPVADPANPPEDPAILAALLDPPGPDAHGGQYVIDPQDRRRGPFDLTGIATHPWRQSPYHREALLCADCHDVSNPLYTKDPSGSYRLGPLNVAHPTMDKGEVFPIERTFAEWDLSVFSVAEIEMGGRFGGNKTAVSTCQDCHMPDATGSACLPGLGNTRDDLPLHEFNGANSWVLRAVRFLYPDSETGLSAQLVDEAIARNVDMLGRAGDLSAFVRGTQLVVRVVNQTGHKLPTGYGEGRRMWLDLRFFDGLGNLLAQHGHYDPLTADLTTGDTRVYEVVHGLDDHAAQMTGLPAGASFHFLLNNEILKDNRVPPRGFDPDAFDAVGAPVVAHDYPQQHYWDDAAYDLPLGATRVEVRLFHQTTSRAYIEFLRNENATNSAGQLAHDMWAQFGKSAPVEMASVDLDLTQPSCTPALPYGLGKATSLGPRAELGSSGAPSVAAADFALEVTGGVPNQSVLYFSSGAPAGLPYAGGWLLVGGPLVRSAVFTLDPQGEVTVPVAVTPAMVGTRRYYQVMFRDPGDPTGLGLTNGLHVDFCD